MKRFIGWLLLVVVSVAFVGCGESAAEKPAKEKAAPAAKADTRMKLDMRPTPEAAKAAADARAAEEARFARERKKYIREVAEKKARKVTDLLARVFGKERAEADYGFWSSNFEQRITMTMGGTDGRLTEPSESEFRNKVDSEGEKLAVEQAEGAAQSLKGANDKLKQDLDGIKERFDALHGR